MRIRAVSELQVAVGRVMVAIIFCPFFIDPVW